MQSHTVVLAFTGAYVTEDGWVQAQASGASVVVSGRHAYSIACSTLSVTAQGGPGAPITAFVSAFPLGELVRFTATAGVRWTSGNEIPVDLRGQARVTAAADVSGLYRITATAVASGYAQTVSVEVLRPLISVSSSTAAQHGTVTVFLTRFRAGDQILVYVDNRFSHDQFVTSADVRGAADGNVTFAHVTGTWHDVHALDLTTLEQAGPVLVALGS